jgi:thiol peroxidase
MSKTIKFNGEPFDLIGRRIHVGETATDFRVCNSELKTVRLSDYPGKVRLITSFPSLDTPVCQLQVREFNKRASDISPEITVIGISKDLPFAQERFKHGFDIKNVQLFSDFQNSSFGVNFGVLVKHLHLLARAVFIVDKTDVIRYIQIVDELTHAPDYDASLRALESVVETPLTQGAEKQSYVCKPCEQGAEAMPREEILSNFKKLKGWDLVEDAKIKKDLKFPDFEEARYFNRLIEEIAQDQQHHPEMDLNYNHLTISLTTHTAHGLTANDFKMAALIDELEA